MLSRARLWTPFLEPARQRRTYRIISVHRTASCSSISLSLYWFLSISTRAISTRVNLRRCVSVMSPSGWGGSKLGVSDSRLQLVNSFQIQAPLTSSPPSSLESRDAPSASARSLRQKGRGPTRLSDQKTQSADATRKLVIVASFSLPLQFFLQLLHSGVHLVLGLPHGLQLLPQHLLLPGQLVHFGDEVVLHYVEGVPVGAESREPAVRRHT